MSQENVEVMRQALDAVNRGDKALWLAACDPEIENIPPRDWPESEPTRGPATIWDFFVATLDAWDEATFEYTQLSEAATNRLLAQMSAELEGKTSGAQVTWSFWLAVMMREGKALRIEWFAEHAEALKAVGIEA